MPKHTNLGCSQDQLIYQGSCALGVMTKAPQPRMVKTRLVPPLTYEEAAELNACFLRDISTSIANCCSIGQRLPEDANIHGLAIYTPVGAESAYESILPREFLLMPQRGDTFGERLILAAEDLFATGFASVCLINSDSPTVLASSFAEAVSELVRPGDRVVLGPSDDGGYYLIGLKQLHRRLFEEIDWSTERVFEQTKQRANELGLSVHELPAGFDVDDRGSLIRLCNELLGANASGGVAAHTRRFLREIIEREGRDRIWPE